jgi:ribosomal-protein-alanine N-acetyltransferase
MHAKFIETERLYLRDFKLADLDAVLEYDAIPDFSQYIQWETDNEGYNLQFIHNCMAKAARTPRYKYDMALLLKSNDVLIGSANIELDAEHSRIGHIGYSVSPKYQNQGYGVEISNALIEYGFKQLNLLVTYATCDTRNVASYKVMEKCGMIRVGEAIGDRKIKGKTYNSYRYEIYENSK